MPLPSPRNITNMNITTTSPRGEPTAESTTGSASLPAATTTTSAAATAVAASSSASSSTSTTTTTTTMMHIASTLCREGREAWQQHDTVLALQKFGIAARVLETALGSFHPLVAKTYYWIGFIYKHSWTMRRSISSSVITDNVAVAAAITNSQMDLEYLLLALAAFTKSVRIRFSLPEKKKKNHDSNSTTATTSTTTITKNPIQETKQAIQWVVRAIQDKCETRTKQDVPEILHHHDFHFKSWWQQLQTFQAIILTTNSGQNSGKSNISSFDGTYYLDRLQHSIQLEGQGDALLRSYQYETALESYQRALSEFPDPHHASLWAKCAFVHCQLHIQQQKQQNTDSNNNSQNHDHHHFLMKSTFQYRQALKILYASHTMVLQVQVKQPQDDTNIMERPSSNNNDNADSSASKNPIFLPLEDHPDTKTTLERLVQVIQEVDENSSTIKQQDPPHPHHPINNTTPQLLSASSSSSSLLSLSKAMMQSVRMEHLADEYLWKYSWATRMRIITGRVTNHSSIPSPNLHHFQWLLPKAQQRYHQALNAMLAATCNEGDGGGGRGGSSGQLSSSSSSSFARWKDPTIQWLKQCIEETNLIQEPILTDNKASSLSSSHPNSNEATLHRSSNSGSITTTTNTTNNSRSNNINNNTGINRMIRTLASKIIQSPPTPKASSSTMTTKKTTMAEAPTNSESLDMRHTTIPIYGPAMDSHDLKQRQRQKPSQSLEGIEPPPLPLSEPMTSNKPTVSQSNANRESDRPWKASAATTGTGASCSLSEQPLDVVKLQSQIVMLLEQSKELRNTISKQNQTIEELQGHIQQQSFKEEDNNNIQQSSLQPQCIGDSQDPSNDRTCLVQELQSMNDELRRTLATTSKQLVAVQLGKEQVSQSLSQVQSKFNKSELQLQKAESELSLLESRLRTSRERAGELSEKRRARMSSTSRSSGSGSLQPPSQSNDKELKQLLSSHQTQTLNDLKESNIHNRQWDRMEPRNVTVPRVHAVPQTTPVQRQLEQTYYIGDQQLFSQSTSSKPNEEQAKERTDKYTQTVQSPPAPPLLQQPNNNDDHDWKSEVAGANFVPQQQGTASKLDRLEQELFTTHQKYQQMLWKSRRLETELALSQPKVPSLLPSLSSSSSLPSSTKEDHLDMDWVARNIEIPFEKSCFLRETLKQTKLEMESVRQSLMVTIMAEQEEVELGTDREQQQKQLKILLEETMIKFISMIATLDSSCSLADTFVQDKEIWFAQINTLVHTKHRIENIAKNKTQEAAVQTFQEGLESLRNNDQSIQFMKKGTEKEENMESFSNDVPIFAAKLDTIVQQKGEEIVQWEKDNLLLQEKCKEYDNKYHAAVAKLDAATAELQSLRNAKATLEVELECIKKEHSSILLSELLQQNPSKEDGKDEENQTNNHSLLVAKEVAAQVPLNLQKHKDDLAEKDRKILQLQQELESLTSLKNKNMSHTHIMNSSNNSGQASAVESHQQDTIHPAPPDATIYNELEFLRSQLTELKAKQSTEVVSKATALVSHVESYQKDVANTLNELSKEIAALAQPPPPEQPTNEQSVGEQNNTESPSSIQLPLTGFMMGRHKEVLGRIQTSIKFLQRDRSKQFAAITRLRLQNNQAADLIATMTSQLKSRNHKYKILRQRTTKLICVFDSLEQHIRTLRRSCQSLGVATVTPIQQSLIELGHDLHAIHVLSKGLKAVNKAQPPVSATVSTSQSLSSLSLLTNDMNATAGETNVSIFCDYGVASAPAILNEQPLVIAQDPLLTMAASYISTRIETDLAVYEIRNLCRSSVQDDRRDESWLINMFGSSHPPNHKDMPTPWYQYWSSIRSRTASSHLEVVARIKVDDNQCLLYVQVMKDGKSCRIWTRNRSATMGDKEDVEWTDHGNPNVRDRPLGWVAINTMGNNQLYFSFDEVLEEAWLIREQYGRKLYHCYTQLSSLRSALQSWRWLRQYYIDHKDVVVAACLVMTALQNVTWWWRE